MGRCKLCIWGGVGVRARIRVCVFGALNVTELKKQRGDVETS